MLFRAVLVWIGLMVAAILNGALRAAILIPRLGESGGHVVSTLVLCAVIALVTWTSVAWIDPATLTEAAGVGALWLSMTIAFEFGAGHYLFGRPWAVLLEDYHVLQGRIWILVLLTTALAPPLAARGRGLR